MNYIPVHCKFNLIVSAQQLHGASVSQTGHQGFRAFPPSQEVLMHTIFSGTPVSRVLPYGWVGWGGTNFFQKLSKRSTPREHNSVEGIIFMRNVVSHPPLCCSIGFHNNGEVIIERKVPLPSNLILLYMF